MVVFPAPVAPMRPMVWPRSRRKDTSSRLFSRRPPAKLSARSPPPAAWVKDTWSNSKTAPLSRLRSSVRGRTGWSLTVSMTSAIRRAEADALESMMNTRLRPMTLWRIMVK